MLFRLASIAAIASVALPLAAQRTYTAQDYAQAERWMSYNVRDLVHHTISGVTYLPDGRVFYRDPAAGGTAYMLADPSKGTTAPAFDNAKLAAALSSAGHRKLDAQHLDITAFEAEPTGFAVTTRSGKFHCDAAIAKCTPEPVPPAPMPVKPSALTNTTTQASATKPTTPPPAAPSRRRGPAGDGNISPDKKLVAFIRDNNLWLRTVATGEERALTTDGIEDFGYATDNAGWEHSDRAIVTWSADSKKLATFQLDQRKVLPMYLVEVTNRHPKLDAWKYPLVGDKDVAMISPVVIDVASATMVRLKTDPLFHRSMECDDIACNPDGSWTDVAFSPDDSQLAFVATSRDHKDEWVRIASTATGDIRDVYHEHVDTYYGWQSNWDWKYLFATNELLWVSERSNYAQIYLYDGKTGKLKNQITRGDGPVTNVLHVDEKNRVLYFTASGKEKGLDPYFDQYYRIDFDGKHFQRLTPEDANHVVTASADGSTFVDSFSTIETPQTTVMRDNMGRMIMTLGHQDVSQLMAAGWKAPTPVTVKARDGKTDIYGFLWKPTNFDASRKYPVVDYVYPGPQGSSCPPRIFSAARGDNQALAELGFIVVCIDGQGNPQRSKHFHDIHASKPEEMGDDTIPDQVAALKELAAKNSWIDLDRVGIWGHSGGGNATASAMFHFPDFFKVGWAESGNHDQRDYEDDWDERWAGLEVIGPDGKSNYDAQANWAYAKNLKGHLMLVHGTSDDNVPPNNTLMVVDALIKANRSFDLLMIPNAHHGYGEATQYTMRRRWDYFVRYLAGGTPPDNYQPKPYSEVLRAIYGPEADE